MKDALRAQFKDMQELHTPRADFVRGLEARLAEAPVQEPVSEHFPAQLARAFTTFVESLVPAQLAPVAQRLSALLLVFGVAVGGWIGAVSASYNAVPGEALYNVKLATERVQLAAVEVTGDKTRTAKLHSSFAERRANEVKRVIEKNKQPEQAQAAMALLTKSVNDANTAIKEAQADPETSDAAIETTEELLADNERIAASLRSVLETLPPNVSDLIDDIVVLHGELTDNRLSTLQDIVRTQIEGRANLSPEQTRDIVIRALTEISDSTNKTVALAKQLEEETVPTQQESTVDDTDTTNSTSESALADAPVEPLPTATSTTLVEASSTINVTSTPSNTTTTPEVASPLVQLSDIEGISADVQTQIETVETLVLEGNLLEALEKAKSINTKQVEIEQVVKKVALERASETPVAAETDTDQMPATPVEQDTNTDTTAETDVDLPSSTIPSTTTIDTPSTTTSSTSTTIEQ